MMLIFQWKQLTLLRTKYSNKLLQLCLHRQIKASKGYYSLSVKSYIYNNNNKNTKLSQKLNSGIYVAVLFERFGSIFKGNNKIRNSRFKSNGIQMTNKGDAEKVPDELNVLYENTDVSDDFNVEGIVFDETEFAFKLINSVKALNCKEISHKDLVERFATTDELKCLFLFIQSLPYQPIKSIYPE